MPVRPQLYKKKHGYSSRKLAQAIELHNNQVVATTSDPNQRSLNCYEPVARPFFIKKNGKIKNADWLRSKKSYNACLAGDSRVGGIAGTASDVFDWGMDLYDQLTNPAGLTDEQANAAFMMRDDTTSLDFKKAGFSGPVMWGAIGLLAVVGVMAVKKGS